MNKANTCSHETVIHSLGETVINKCYQMAGGDKCGEKNEAGIGSAECKDLRKQAFIKDGQKRSLIN